MSVMMFEHKYSQRFEEIFNLTRRISGIFGADIIRNNYKICKRTAFIFMLTNIGIGLTFYTIYIEQIVKGNHYQLLKSLSVLGTGIQGYVKLVNGIKQQEKFRFLYKEIAEMYQTYETNSLAYKECLGQSISLLKKLLGTLLTLVTLTTFIVIIVPVFMLVVLKRRVEVLPLQLPTIDNETDFGYYLTSSFHFMCVLVAGFGNFIVDSWIFIYVAHAPLIKNILKCKFEDIDILLDADTKEVEKLSELLTDIFKRHQKYIVFCNTIKNTFFWVIFVQISTEFFGIVCTIICIFLGIWPPAPAYLIYLFAMVYSYCSLGNLIEISNDEITTMIYDCSWYNLPVVHQKMILIMLRESQQATGMSIGGVAPLSLSTALQLTKTIYTFSMMLNEFLN